jgi:AmmeMemoRadiSam system protein B
MIVSATLMPHSPIIIPEIGGKDSKKIQTTVSAMEGIAEFISDSDPDTIVIISPHSLIWNDFFIFPNNSKIKGSMFDFGHPEIEYELKIDLKLATEIFKKIGKKNLAISFFDNEKEFADLDHGLLVPLHFILKETTSFKILPLSISFLSYQEHIKYGKSLFDIFQKSPKRISIIASGDLSHQLKPWEKKQYTGEKFDNTIIENLKKQNYENIFNLDAELIENAGECGYRSLLILLGILENIEHKSEVLSYEGPFGIGYCCIKFDIL